MSNGNINRRTDHFMASASPGVIYFDPYTNDPAFTNLTAPQLPPHVIYTNKSVRWVVPKGKALNIKAELYGIKALSVFLSMVDDARYIQLYKGEANSQPSRSILHHYADPIPNDQEYVLTTASKDTPGRESKQPWFNAHPLGVPRTDGYKIMTVWQTDDSRNPGSYPNITVTWFHEGYFPEFKYIE